MQIDYGKSYFDALKRYVSLQKEFDEYQRRSRMRFVAMIAICWGSCVVQRLMFLLNLIFN